MFRKLLCFIGIHSWEDHIKLMVFFDKYAKGDLFIKWKQCKRCFCSKSISITKVSHEEWREVQ